MGDEMPVRSVWNSILELRWREKVRSCSFKLEVPGRDELRERQYDGVEYGI